MDTNLNQTETLNKSELREDVNSLIRTLQVYGEDSQFYEINIDLASFAFGEFIASERFSEIGGIRRKQLFTQYETLKSVLSELQEFVTKYEFTSITINDLEIE